MHVTFAPQDFKAGRLDRTWGKFSLVPRPFPPPVFDRLQYANTEGKAWEIWSCAVTSGRQKVDTRGAVPDSSNCRFVSNRPWYYERRMVLTLSC